MVTSQLPHLGSGKYQGMKWDGSHWVTATAAELVAGGHSVPPPNPADVMISTAGHIAGQVLVRHLGVVTTSQSVNSATGDQADHDDPTLRDGLRRLQEQALALGATGVNGVQMQTVSGPVSGAAAGAGATLTLLMMGTAVVTVSLETLRESPALGQAVSRGGMGFGVGVGVGIPLDF